MSEHPAFAAMYEATIPAVWRFVRSRVGDREQAEDLTSDVYVRALAAWDRFDPKRGSPTAWLCGIAAHTVQEWRRRRRWTSLSAATEPPEGNRAGGGDPEPEAMMVQAEEMARLGAALALLSERERDALALRFAAGLRAWEVGLVLGLSAGATKMLLFRATKRLRATLELAAAAPVDDQAAAAALDETVDRVLARRGTEMPEQLAERLVRQLAIIYSHPVPRGLTARVTSVVACPVARVVARPGRRFKAAAAVVAVVSLAAAVWRWQAAAPANLMEPILLTAAGCAVLVGLGLIARRPVLASGTIGIGALIFALCLWWTGIAPLLGLVMAGSAFRQATRLPTGLAGLAPGVLARRG